MYEFLRSLFGQDENGEPVALTFDQFVEKLNENKEIKLVNLEDGGYVSKEKLDAKITELEGVRGQLETANATIQSYVDMDIDGIKQSAKDWEQKYNEETQALNEKLAKQERSHNEDMFLNGYNFSSVAAKNGVRAEFVAKNFPFENGSFVGGKEFMEGLMARDDYKAAFVVSPPPADSDPEPTPPAPPKPQFSSPLPPNTPPAPKKSLTELMREKNENPNAVIKYD